MILNIRAISRSDDSGLTLVEIVIYMTLAVVVGAIVVSMFIGTIKGQDQVTSTTQATTRGQVVAQGIEKALRNATAVNVSTDGTTLKVLTTLDDQCQGWRVRGGNIEVATNQALTAWAVFATDVTAASGNPFGYGGSDGYTYSLAFDTDTRPVNFVGTVTPRGTGGDLGGTCS